MLDRKPITPRIYTVNNEQYAVYDEVDMYVVHLIDGDGNAGEQIGMIEPDQESRVPKYWVIPTYHVSDGTELEELPQSCRSIRQALIALVTATVKIPQKS